MVSCGSFSWADVSRDFEDLFAMSLQEIAEVEVATGTTKQLSEVPAIVSVVTAEDIALTGAHTLAEAMEQIPGLHVTPSLNRLNTLFSIRGIFTDASPQVLVMIDGMEISELTALSVPYAFNYPVNFVDRIEVIRGPGSAVHGADAFSGVVNIITKGTGDRNSATAGARLGSFDTSEAWFNGSLAVDDWKLALSVTRREQGSDDDRVTPYGALKRDGELDNVHLNIDYKQFSIKNWYWRTKQFMGVGAGIVANTIDRDITETWHSKLSWQDELAAGLNTSFDLSYSRSSFDALFQLFPPGIWPVGADGNVFQPPFTLVDFPDGVIGAPAAATRRVAFDAAAVYSGIDGHRIRFGIGFENADLSDVEESKNFGPGILDTANLPANAVSQTIVDVSNTEFAYTPAYDRDVSYVSIQNEWKVTDNLELTAGLRFDKYSDFGSTTNPRLALVWNVSATLTSKFLFGTAFRAPKVAELAFINNPTTLGNPDLEPEEIDTWELAFDYRQSNTLTTRLNVFYYKAKELIQLDSAFVHQNVGEQNGKGFELEFDWQASDNMNVRANLSWLDAKLPQLGEDKERVPGVMAFADIRYRLSDAFIITAQNYWISGRKRQPGDERAEVDDYLKTDLNLLWQPGGNWDVSLSFKNLLNETITEPVPDSALFGLGLGFPGDYPMPGRSITASVIYSF